MADPPSYPERDARADRGPTAGTPRWVKVSGIIALAVVLLLIIVLLTGGNHGPGRHASSRGVGGPLGSVPAATQDRR
jgi:hypothetical protein